jgi:hypothetical protein
MPCANWSVNAAGTLYKYKDTTGTPKVGKIKAGLLMVVSPGMGGLPVPNGDAAITAQVTVGTDRYCLRFIGTGDGDKFLVKDATAGSCPQTCGNNVIDAGEQCDGSSAGTCAAGCGPGCTCLPTSPCGDNLRVGSEQCDGTDASACPGQCQSNCTCPVCGDNSVGGTEQCDGSAQNGACAPELCSPFCTCTSLPVCGDNFVDFGEECDGSGTFGASCSPAQCQSDCTCADSVCGNNVVEDGENCDPPGSQCGVPGTCNSGCFCDNLTCGVSPTCGGDCPAGGSCADLPGGCVCAGPIGGCGTVPTCGGSCPADYECRLTGFIETCTCIAGDIP